MPILVKNNIVCHFAHIPKCGGSSISNYCQTIGIKIGFTDKSFVASPASQPWNISSPQHIDGYSLSRLFFEEFFDFGFAVSRYPVSRLISAFKHQITQNKISKNTNLNEFIIYELQDISKKLGVYDNHFLPQTKFLIPGMQYQVFRLEESLDHVKQFIDSKFQNTNLERKILHYNGDRTKDIINPKHLSISEKAMDIIRKVYEDDFSNLGYSFSLSKDVKS